MTVKLGGTFDYIVKTSEGFEAGECHRSSIIDMINDDRTKRVELWVNGKMFKNYVKPAWAAKVLAFVPAKSVVVKFIVKGSE